MGGLRQQVNSEFERLEEDLLYTEKALFAASEHYRFLHYVLGILAAVASAITAVSALNSFSAPSVRKCQFSTVFAMQTCR